MVQGKQHSSSEMGAFVEMCINESATAHKKLVISLAIRDYRDILRWSVNWLQCEKQSDLFLVETRIIKCGLEETIAARCKLLLRRLISPRTLTHKILYFVYFILFIFNLFFFFLFFKVFSSFFFFLFFFFFIIDTGFLVNFANVFGFQTLNLSRIP